MTYDVSEGQGLYSRNGGRSFGLDSRGGQSGDILSYDGSEWELKGLESEIKRVAYDTVSEIEGITINQSLKALEVETLSQAQVLGVLPADIALSLIHI